MSLIERRCCVCESACFEEVYSQPTGAIIGIDDIDYMHRIVICKECGFVYASPVLDDEQITKYYKTVSNYENPQSKGENNREDKNKFDRMYQFVSERFPAQFKGNALDIGCAVAYGLFLFKKSGWNVLGIDPSIKCAEISRQLYDVTVAIGTFEKNLLELTESSYDLVILSHVVEHLKSPQSLISNLRSLLTDSGVLYIEVPNLLKTSDTMTYFNFEHVNYFTPTTLTSFMGKIGFQLDHLETYDNSPDIMPFYPVIASTWRKSALINEHVISDYTAAFAAVRDYDELAGKEIRRLQRIVDDILVKIPTGRLALWGAGLHTSQLMSVTRLSSNNLAFIIDNDQKKHGQELNGVKVIPFNDDPYLTKSLIDAIIISTKAGELAVYNQISHMENYGIQVLRLYDNYEI